MTNFKQRYLHCIERMGYGADELVGCMSNEIAAVEEAAGFILPMAYREFLQLLGKSAGGFLREYTVFFPAMIELNDKCKAEFKHYLPDSKDYFVFISRMGDEYLFFCQGEGDDPPIYGWRTDQQKYEQRLNSFSEMIQILTRTT